MCMQALQQLWESARFTYQVNGPTSQANPQRPSQATPAASRLRAPAAELAANSEPEARSSSDSDEEGSQQRPLPGSSQMMTRRAEQSSALPAANAR